VFEDALSEGAKKTSAIDVAFDELPLSCPRCQLVQSRLAVLLSDSVDSVELSTRLNRKGDLRTVGRVPKDRQQHREDLDTAGPSNQLF